MSTWWVRAEESFGAGVSWHGPFADVEAAQRVAADLSKPVTAGDRFAEVVSGSRGGNGIRIREFFRGMDYLPGESGWHRVPPRSGMDIPEDAGR
jgi:hypothetical protein